MATILYFINDVIASKVEKIDILGLGFDVCQRNARFVDKEEPCDGVIFSPELSEDSQARVIFKKYPEGKSVIAKIKKDREVHFANLQAELQASIALEEKEKTEDDKEKKPSWGS